MSSLSVGSKPGSIWSRIHHYFENARNWPANGNGPYSPLFCICLLLAVGVIVKIGH